MKVIATAEGFHGKLRQAGEVFDVREGEKGSWFVPADKQTPVAQAPAKSAKPAGKAEAPAKPAEPAGKQHGNDLV